MLPLYPVGLMTVFHSGSEAGALFPRYLHAPRYRLQPQIYLQPKADDQGQGQTVRPQVAVWPVLLEETRPA